MTPSGRRSNKELTAEERKRKNELKKEFKAKQKRAKLEARLRHAISRKDERVERETRLLLGNYVLEEVVDENETSARAFVLNLYTSLKQRQRAMSESCNFSKMSKEIQSSEAVHLLRHMTKGTQMKNMFDNKDALWGYTRQKFQERSLLVYKSMSKLRPDKINSLCLDQQEAQRRCKAWEAITEIRNVCSIGCGPGCDAVGVLALLQTIAKSSETGCNGSNDNVRDKDKLLGSVCLLDWAIDQWSTILNILKELLATTLVKEICCSSCDITKSLIHDNFNLKARALMCPLSSANINKSSGDDCKQCQDGIDLYLFSYILTETRDKWQNFWNELVDKAKPNALFYIAEPTPWQIHKIISMEEERKTCGKVDDEASRLEFIWLDSSIDQPAAVQALNGRLGPGVLLARKVI
mmetsp:Transcript_27376/g.41436  ORF Transcript_27376/g.41436 Transcript_27376/m.41436 type:complete len:409 (-) Transcript_27376:107-1333(-)|eukprot:CAMPEP_0178901746 /NCGR_PEP_ID=MMETSP0786-20121207/4210_1 /TAXON_ID=186022 /ORGANISM="Thalassionema frauenfeldii, Strain CCMP 1798" /LENGTH=408 /DNA_ID=CAMNT_0020572915 /DNA_START=234 /DNA_END=1460 /DNA_ORIENTATION=-